MTTAIEFDAISRERLPALLRERCRSQLVVLTKIGRAHV